MTGEAEQLKLTIEEKFSVIDLVNLLKQYEELHNKLISETDALNQKALDASKMINDLLNIITNLYIILGEHRGVSPKLDKVIESLDIFILNKGALKA